MMGTEAVQFCHFSVKEFLTSDRIARSRDDVSLHRILLEPAHTILAQACLGVLLRLDDLMGQDDAGEIPLAENAARHWFYHAQFENISQPYKSRWDIYLIQASHISQHGSGCTTLITEKQCVGFSSLSRPRRAEPLYYAAYCGFYDLEKHLIAKRLEHVNARGDWKVTPLAAALYGDHLRVAELLYHNNADVHVRGHENDTLLHAVAVYKPIDPVL